MQELKTHHELGRQLKLFFFDEKSPGSAFFYPKGAILYNNLMNFFRNEYEKRGYQEVITPNIFDKSLWETSGHWHKYKENMFVIEKHQNHHCENEQVERQFSLKAMNCITGDSIISLSNCTSVRMDQMINPSNNLVLGYDSAKSELVNTNKINFINSGIKDCIEIMLLDGRKLVCTPEHQILTDKGWIEANKLIEKESNIYCGISYPIISQEINNTWEIIIETETEKTKEKEKFTFNMKSYENINKTLAFARLCGIIVTDGSIFKDKKNRYKCEIYTGHNIDLRNIMNDVKLVFGDLYNNTFGKKRNLWRVTLSSKISRLFAKILGYGNRMFVDSSFPEFILDKSLPIDILRQFLSGVFGGDGWAPVLSGNCFTEIYIALSKSKEKLQNLLDYMNKMSELLSRCNITKHNITGPYKNNKGDHYHYRIKINSESINDFAKYIGFSYCCHKAMRLSVVDSYYKLKKNILEQHNNFKNKYIQEIGNNPIENKKKIYERLKKEASETQYIFNEKFSIPSQKYLDTSLRIGSELKHMGGKGFYSPKEYVKEIDAEKIFSTNSYSVEINHELPMFKLKFLTKKNVGKKQVYDISVDNNIQSFVANGIVVHNCPSHCLLFNKMSLSYRDLPIRLADFGVLHRNEVHGALTGLTRVRRFCQDDAHIFCRMSQIEEEIKGVIDFIKYIYDKFEMKFSVGLSTRPEQYIGDLENWNKAEEILKNIISTFDNHHINEGDGAFYGPKLDFTVIDTLNRKHQLATIQLDFNLPERFNLEFKAEEGYERPVMIHRAILGSIERFIAILLESKQGDIPFFVSPRQIAILTVNDSEDLIEYAKEIKKEFNQHHIKYVDYIDDKETISKKILNTEVLHYNYIIVLGKKELKNNTINVRGIGEIKLEDFINKLKID